MNLKVMLIENFELPSALADGKIHIGKGSSRLYQPNPSAKADGS
jgi:hypothetical protein